MPSRRSSQSAAVEDALVALFRPSPLPRPAPTPRPTPPTDPGPSPGPSPTPRPTPRPQPRPDPLPDPVGPGRDTEKQTGIPCPTGINDRVVREDVCARLVCQTFREAYALGMQEAWQAVVGGQIGIPNAALIADLKSRLQTRFTRITNHGESLPQANVARGKVTHYFDRHGG